MPQPVFRFAPSPNGRLHLGHAYSALLNASLAERLAGRQLLRIEDIDLTRCRSEYVAGIEDDLAWLGIQWEKPPRRQSEHFDDYRGAVDRLRRQGLLYRCFCSRKDLADDCRIEGKAGAPLSRDPDGVPLYPGTCKRLPDAVIAKRIESSAPHTWRIDVEKAREAVPQPLGCEVFNPDGSAQWEPAHPVRWGDAVVVRRDVPTSYHLSVVVDDALQGVTHVVRGRDLEAATELHVLLQALLGLPTPLYHHHALIRDEGGDKLAKSRSSRSLADMRREGVSAAEVRRWLGMPAIP